MKAPSTRRPALLLAAWLVLLAGVGDGVLLYRRGSEADSGDATVTYANQRATDQAIERNVGSLGLLESQWSAFIADLFESHGLAVLVVVVSVGAAGGLFWMSAARPLQGEAGRGSEKAGE